MGDGSVGDGVDGAIGMGCGVEGRSLHASGLKGIDRGSWQKRIEGESWTVSKKFHWIECC